MLTVCCHFFLLRSVHRTRPWEDAMKFPGRQRAVPAASHEPQREHVRRSGGAFGRPALLAGAACALAVTLTPVSAQQAERVDLTAIYKIKAEGLQRSRVMEITSWLTDVYGPRLTNSPGFRKAGEWAVKEMTSWGLVNVKLQPFGPFGRGWTNDKFYMMATTPGGSLPVIGYPQAWTSGTNGVVAGDAVFATIDSPEDITTWKGKLKGKFLLSTAMPDVPALFDAQAQRYTDDELRELVRETVPTGRGGRGGRGAFGGGRGGTSAFALTRTQFLKDEGVVAIITPGRGTGGTVFVGGGGSREANAPATIPAVTLLQRGQRHRRDSRHLPAAQRGRGANLRRLDEAFEQPWHDYALHPKHWGDRSPAFDAVGLSGFQFVQDPVEYGTRTHHSNMDLYERIQEEDMRKNAVIVASFVYLAANRDQPLPRKPLPAPQPVGAGRGQAPGGGSK
jgi:hypothetical protein